MVDTNFHGSGQGFKKTSLSYPSSVLMAFLNWKKNRTAVKVTAKKSAAGSAI